MNSLASEPISAAEQTPPSSFIFSPFYYAWQ